MTQCHISWDSYKHNICNGFSLLQQKEEFVDMTLAADGHLVKVHRNVMALASPFIKEMLHNASCQHPVIFLNCVSHEILCYILEYIYTGEVKVSTDKMNLFITTAKALQIIGVNNMLPPMSNPFLTKKKHEENLNCDIIRPRNVSTITENYIESNVDKETAKKLENCNIENLTNINQENNAINNDSHSEEQADFEVDTNKVGDNDVDDEVTTNTYEIDVANQSSQNFSTNDFEIAINNFNLASENAHTNILQIPTIVNDKIEENNLADFIDIENIEVSKHTNCDYKIDVRLATNTDVRNCQTIDIGGNITVAPLTSNNYEFDIQKGTADTNDIDNYINNASGVEPQPKPIYNFVVKMPDSKKDPIIEPGITVDTGVQPISSSNVESTADASPLYMTSNRGSLTLILNRFMYHQHHTSRGGRKRRWRCIDYRLHRCKAFVDTDGEFIMRRKFVHIHRFHDDKIVKKAKKCPMYSTISEVLARVKSTETCEVIASDDEF